MSIQASDIKFRKSEVVADTTANGGRKGQVLVVSGARHNLFPRISKAERTTGTTKYRKEFWCNENADDDIAYDVMDFLEFPSNGGDRFAIGKGTQIDTQNDIYDNPEFVWLGVGSLNTLLNGSETEVDLLMESDDFAFPNGGHLHLTNKFMISQTIAFDVKIGDSVELIAGTWEKIAATDDITYPNGLCVGSDAVMSVQVATNEEWLSIKDYLYTDEDIGNGDGMSLTPVLTNLLHGTNGICLQSGKLPVVTATVGAATKTVNIAADGTCSGYCSAGELNMANGIWITDITWTVAPDNGTDVLITYRENCYKYVGNVVTVYLDEQVANAYAVNNSYGAGCVEEAEVTPLSASWNENSGASGTYDETTYPLVLYNDGAEQDSWTITFTSPTAFGCSGAKEGSVGTGVITEDFSPTNPHTGQPYFKLDYRGFGGTWQSGDTITFTTDPSAVPIWWREIVPPATATEPDNLCVLGWYAE